MGWGGCFKPFKQNQWRSGAPLLQKRYAKVSCDGRNSEGQTDGGQSQI